MIGLIAGLFLAGQTARAQEPPPAPSPADQAGPTVSILSTQLATDGTVNLELEVTTEDGSAPNVELRIDEKVVADATMTRARDLIRPNLFMMTAALPRRDCVLTVIARSHDQQSAPVSVRLRWNGRRAATDLRPALYVLAVGVGQYQDPEISRLSFPSKDARDLAATLQTQRATIYRTVEAELRLEQEATRPRILAGLSWLQKKVQPSDTAVIFLAGHGTNDPTGTYYYLPYDASTDLRTMLSGSDLQAELKNIAGRVLLLLDTCHSGGVLGRRSMTRLINELTSENKIVVFAASTGQESSRESPAWKNGAFTKALVEGLRGVADYEENGVLSLSELETWVGVRVRKLTQGGQTPTVAKPNALPDYVVAALPKERVLPTPRQAQRRRLLAGLLGGGAAAAILIGVLAARPWEGRGQPTTELVFH